MAHQRHYGFTIVELLIVIVVIGILAAITITTYSGIQKQAIVASLVSDLDNASKRLKLDQIDLGAYPATTILANSGAGLRASGSTTYQYSVNNSVSPQTFCLTATNGTTSHYINQDSTPQSGACTGHILGGAEIITNMAINPNLESNATGWSPSNVVNLSTNHIQVSNNWVYQATRLTTAAAAVRFAFSTPIVVTSGGTYTHSATITSTVNQNIRVDVRVPGGTTVMYSSTYPMAANIPQRLSTTGAVTGGTVYLGYLVDPLGAVGDTITVDNVMFTSGPTVYNYADGNSAGWTWSGAPNETTSTGPAP